MSLVKRPILLLLMCGALGLAACGGGDDDSDDGGTTDDGSTDDGSTDDGSTDDGGDDGGTVDPAGTDNTFVLSELLLPTETNDYSVDLDGDDMADNQLGMLLGVLAGQGLDVQGAVTEQIDQGGVILLANVKATDLASAEGVGFYVYLGDNPNPEACAGKEDTECRLHLAGDATFDIAEDSPTDAVVVGANANGSFVGGPGEVTLELSLAALADPLVITLSGARVEVGVAADALSDGVLGGAITEENIQGQLIPGITAVLNGLLEESGCSADMDPCCPEGSTGEDILTFIPDEDCVYTPEEVASSAAGTLISQPDVDLDPAVEGNDAISLGVGFSAVPGSFTPP